MKKFFQCDSCGTIFLEKELLPARNLEQRIDVGGTYTPYECPDQDCGALCYPVADKDRPTCEIEGCERPATAKVGVSIAQQNDSFRLMCCCCEEAYRSGSQHGRMLAETLEEDEPDPDPPKTRTQ